jgi:hypothetical protein
VDAAGSVDVGVLGAVSVDLIVKLRGGQREVRQGVGRSSALDQGKSHAQVGDVDD